MAPERFLVTGSSGHLGEALVRVLRRRGTPVTGLDVLPSPWTDVVGSVADPEAVARAARGATHVLHTATLHKPHVGTHSRRAFVEVNVTGTQTVLDAAATVGAPVVVTSTTSAFGRALATAPGEPAAWIDEDVVPRVRNVYGATKVAAEDLAELAAADGLPVVVLRTSRFFPEPDDRDDVRAAYADAALKALEFAHRRVDLADVVEAHLLAARRAAAVGFHRLVVSATTPFARDDAPALGRDLPGLFAERFPDLAEGFAARGWRLPGRLDRVYDNARARRVLGWAPAHDLHVAARRALRDGDPMGDLAREVGAKGYHPEPTGVYTPHSRR